MDNPVCEWCGFAGSKAGAIECGACGAALPAAPAITPAPQPPPADSVPEPPAPEPIAAEPTEPPATSTGSASAAPSPPPAVPKPPPESVPEESVGEFRPCANPQCLAPVWSEDPFCPACGYNQFGGGPAEPPAASQPSRPPLPDSLPEPVTPAATPLPPAQPSDERSISPAAPPKDPYRPLWAAMGIVGTAAFCLILAFLGFVFNYSFGGLETAWTTRVAAVPPPAQSATVTRTATPTATPTPTSTPTTTPTGTPRPVATGTTTRKDPTVEPGWKAPADLPANASTVLATSDKLYSGVTLYNSQGKFRLQFIGRSDNCPQYPSGKGIIYREANGVPIAQEESNILGWAVNPGTAYRIRTDDPGLATKQWKTYPSCP